MKNIAYFSDCPFFAGCEKMLVHFLSSNQLNSQFNIDFWHQNNKIYTSQLRNHLPQLKSSVTLKPMRLWHFNYPLKLKSRILRGLGILFESFILRYPIFIRNVIYLFYKFKKKNINLLHINNGGYPGARSAQAAVVAAKILGIKHIIYIVNNLAFDYKHPSRWLDWPIDVFVKSQIDFFVTGSRFASDRLGKVLNIDYSHRRVIHNGIQLKKITESPAEVCFRLNISPNRNLFRNLLIGVVALLEERKGHIVLLQALSLLKKRGVLLPFVLIEGEGGLIENLRSYVRLNELDEFVFFIGQENNIANLMNAVDILALPSIANEDFPNVTIEAMSLGKPVIASNLSGIPEQILDGETGFLVEPKDPESLANAIEKILENKALCIKMGAEAKRVFEEKFTVEEAVSKYIKLYGEVLII